MRNAAWTKRPSRCSRSLRAATLAESCEPEMLGSRVAGRNGGKEMRNVTRKEKRYERLWKNLYLQIRSFLDFRCVSTSDTSIYGLIH